MVIVREERPEDLAAVRRVNVRAFGRAAEAELVDALRARGRATLSLVAEDDGELLGHILFSPVAIESRVGTLAALGLAPMAVVPERQRQGVGSLLVRHGLEHCRRAGHECVLVLGHPEYYPRFGFTPASRFGIACGYAAAAGAFMAIELRPGALRGRAGTARYEPEFDAV